ncbi:Zinc finger A20 and AN1 domain-containing stress-associated protein 8 [Capsicum baccatum]|uniref:Zinc finger A20 and AN1 domain-containing stress-associated protein 8 n=1 Tax=Capsicum baccatum TaxID=33114 RepID=A0A2G2VAY8_CAPBA|nr:Zinc finger A20 and AN1 domain-containing stress-associated protein 8 [Capsicum baccatum]
MMQNSAFYGLLDAKESFTKGEKEAWTPKDQRYLDVLTTHAENSHDLGKRLSSTNTGDGNRVMDYFTWFRCIELWNVDMISNPKRREVHLGLVLKVDSQAQVPQLIHRISRSQDIQLLLDLRRETCGVGLDLLTREMESSKETGCRSPEDPILCINNCDFCGSTATMNMCSKCQKDMILLKQEHAKLAAASSKDVVHSNSSSDESELALASAAVASVDLSSQISQVKSKEGLKKCTACRKRVGLMGFSCKCGYLFCAVHHYLDKHNCPFNYRNAGQNAIAKDSPIIVAEKLNKI